MHDDDPRQTTNGTGRGARASTADPPPNRPALGELGQTLPSAHTPGRPPGSTGPLPAGAGQPPLEATRAAVQSAPPVSGQPATWRQVIPPRTGRTLADMPAFQPTSPVPPPASPSMAATQVPQTWRQVVPPRTGVTLMSHPIPTPPAGLDVVSARASGAPTDASAPAPAARASTPPTTSVGSVPAPTPRGLAPERRAPSVLGVTLLGHAAPPEVLAPREGTTTRFSGTPEQIPVARPQSPVAPAPRVAASSAPPGASPVPPQAYAPPGPVRESAPPPQAYAPPGPVEESVPPTAHAPAGPESNRLALRSSLPPPPAATDNLPWLGGYQVLARVRTDAIGTEYLCSPGEDPAARCTLKVLRGRMADEAAAASFLRYANRLAKLNHPSLVGVVDAGVSQQQPYLVRSHVDAVTFSELLEATTAATRHPALVLKIIDDAFDGLLAAHAPRQVGRETVHFVHGALTADHVLVGRDGRSRIVGVGELAVLGPTARDPGQDLLALRILLSRALPGGLDEQALRLRWFAAANRNVRSDEVLRELRQMTASARGTVSSEQVATWVAGLFPPTAPTSTGSRSSAPPAMSSSPPASPRVGGLRGWWRRRFRGRRSE